MAGSHPGFASGASNSANLDLNDFPALGSQGAQVSSGGANSNLFSPYATQAAAGLSNSSMNMGMMGMLSRGAPFTHDEFPALNPAQPAASEPRGAHGVSTSMHPMGTLLLLTQTTQRQSHGNRSSSNNNGKISCVDTRGLRRRRTLPGNTIYTARSRRAP